eukprot:scaffold32153_cov16-Tisochrysis_lutea.AAC.2
MCNPHSGTEEGDSYAGQTSGQARQARNAGQENNQPVQQVYHKAALDLFDCIVRRQYFSKGQAGWCPWSAGQPTCAAASKCAARRSNLEFVAPFTPIQKLQKACLDAQQPCLVTIQAEPRGNQVVEVKVGKQTELDTSPPKNRSRIGEASKERTCLGQEAVFRVLLKRRSHSSIEMRFAVCPNTLALTQGLRARLASSYQSPGRGQPVSKTRSFLTLTAGRGVGVGIHRYK